MEGSEDYELLPHKEIEELRREINILKKNPLADAEKGKSMVESIERLNDSINRLISILEDAQKDIIDEYQNAKPAEKLNALLDQNQTIARALLSIDDSIRQTQEQLRAPGARQNPQDSFDQGFVSLPKNAQPGFIPQATAANPVNMQPQPFPNAQPAPSQFGPQGQFKPVVQPAASPFSFQQPAGAMPSGAHMNDHFAGFEDDVPALGNIQDSAPKAYNVDQLPQAPKKKFLGLL